MRIYLAVIDETDEAQIALRFAAKRAVATAGRVRILALVPKQQFSAFGVVQETIEQEAKDRAEVIANSAAGSLFAELGRMPTITVLQGDAEQVIRDYLAENEDVTALVLGAAKDGNPGPLVTTFAAKAGDLPCPLFIVPGGLNQEQIDKLT